VLHSKLKLRRAYDKRKLEHYQEELKRLTKQLLSQKKKWTGDIFKTISRYEGKCWTEFDKYVKRHKGKRENIPAIKDFNGRLNTKIEKANSQFLLFFGV
jgi:cytoplasmic iron level regulating protein YaaA (DUF328/UPF0246 family)